MCWSQQSGSDLWSPVRGFFDSFNQRRFDVVEPGNALLIDESISANRTKRTVANHCPDGLPHATKIARKPEGVGVEIRNLIDCDSEILLQLDIQECKESMALKPFFVETSGRGSTAGVLRLVSRWFGSGRTIYGDSAFASVLTACWLLLKGLHFMGLVKTGHKFFPKQYFIDQAAKDPPLGSSLYLQASFLNHPMIAVAWFDKVPKHFIATAGTNSPAPPRIKVRYHRETGDRKLFEVPSSAVPKEYFNQAPKIDVHNHRRQGELAMERAHTHGAIA